MKTPLLLLVLATASFAGSPLLVKATPESVITMTSTTAETPAARSNVQSTVKQSSILHDGTNWTLVPKGAVIFTPDEMKGHVDVTPVGTLLSWADFLAKNSGWITTTDISFEQAAEDLPMPAERAASWTNQDKVVVAVHQNGPISVRIASELQPITQR